MSNNLSRMVKNIETENLILFGSSESVLEAALNSNRQLSQLLNAHVPENWTEFGPEPLKFFLDKLRSDPRDLNWCTYFPVHKKDNTLIGSCCYKGKPGLEGIVEVGYEVAPEYRHKGLATEMLAGLIENAFAFQDVKSIQAHTLAEHNYSTRILSKFNFRITDEIHDPGDGLIWVWQLDKE